MPGSGQISGEDAKVGGELDGEVGKQPQGPDCDPDAGQLGVLLTAAKWLESADDERTRAAAVWYAIKDLPHAEQEEKKNFPEVEPAGSRRNTSIHLLDRPNIEALAERLREVLA
ncbi:MAG: hypothetical protein GY856_13420 [bacterium]|nr:hypothetical protein [bacterium]